MTFFAQLPVPAWVLLALLSSSLSAGQMMVQDHFKVAPFPMAFWTKAACATLMLPLALWAGLPTDPVFYICIALQAFLWVVSDVVFYKAIGEVGAGPVSRLMPTTMIVSFFLWFLFDWPLASAYIADPVHSLTIIGILGLIVFFASHLRKCEVTRRAFRALWFVLAAGVTGTIFMKIITRYANLQQGVYAYVLFEAGMMLSYWSIYYLVKKPVAKRIMFGKKTIRCGLGAGAFGAFAVATRYAAFYSVDNPAYVLALRYMDVVIILAAYAIMGKRERANIWAGIGLAACAAMLILAKS